MQHRHDLSISVNASDFAISQWFSLHKISHNYAKFAKKPLRKFRDLQFSKGVHPHKCTQLKTTAAYHIYPTVNNIKSTLYKTSGPRGSLRRSSEIFVFEQKVMDLYSKLWCNLKKTFFNKNKPI